MPDYDRPVMPDSDRASRAPPALNAAENPGFEQEWAPPALNAAENPGFEQEWEPARCLRRKGGPPLSGWKRPLTRSLDVLTPPFMAVACGSAHNVVEQTPSCRWRGTAPCARPPRMAVSAHSLRAIPSAADFQWRRFRFFLAQVSAKSGAGSIFTGGPAPPERTEYRYAVQVQAFS